jgi:hypothetical protein
MFKTPEKKDFPSRRGGTLADNRPTPFDAEPRQKFSTKGKFLAKPGPFNFFFNAILDPSAAVSGRSVCGEVAERLNAAVC